MEFLQRNPSSVILIFFKKGSCLEVAMQVKSNNASLCIELSEGAF